MDQPGKVAIINVFSLSPFVPDNLVSRDGFGHPVPRQPAHSPHSGLNLVLTHGIIPDFRSGVRLFIPPSSHPQVCQVTQLHNDGVHCRESAGTGPVVLKVVPVTGAAFSGFTMDQIMCASLFLYSLMV